jgi:hypothetical protein
MITQGRTPSLQPQKQHRAWRKRDGDGDMITQGRCPACCRDTAHGKNGVCLPYSIRRASESTREDDLQEMSHDMMETTTHATRHTRTHTHTGRQTQSFQCLLFKTAVLSTLQGFRVNQGRRPARETRQIMTRQDDIEGSQVNQRRRPRKTVLV